MHENEPQLVSKQIEINHASAPTVKEIFQVFTNKEEEIKFFLKEYKSLESESFDFYYIIPYQWVVEWDRYITDKTTIYPQKISNSNMLDESHTIRDNLLENVDFVIVPRNVGYFFHDTYGGGRRLKTKHRHLYSSFCDKHDLKTHLKVFEYFFLLENERNNSEENKKKHGCNILLWC